MTNTITATITASQFNAMTKAALFAFAAEKDIKVLKKMDKATLVQTIVTALGQQPAEAPAEASTEQVEEVVVLGSILGGVSYDDIAGIVEIVEDEPVEEVAPTTPEPVQPVAIGSYVKWVKGPSYFKVNRYGYQDGVYSAELVSKKKAADTELSYHYVPATFIGTDKGVTFVPATRQEVALAYKAKQAPKSPIKSAPKSAPVVRETTHANSKRFVVNVSENRFGYRNWSITDKVTKNTFPVEEGKSVTRLVRSYQASVKGVAAKVTITEDQPVRGTNAAPTCPCCQTGLLTQPVLSFFEKNRSKLPAELQATGPVCYSCQGQTGMRRYFSAKEQVSVR